LVRRPPPRPATVFVRRPELAVLPAGQDQGPGIDHVPDRKTRLLERLVHEAREDQVVSVLGGRRPAWLWLPERSLERAEDSGAHDRQLVRRGCEIEERPQGDRRHRPDLTLLARPERFDEVADALLRSQIRLVEDAQRLRQALFVFRGPARQMSELTG
jgi:hypothetical protein